MEIVGWVTEDGQVVCEACAEDLDTEDWTPIFVDSESGDSPTTCEMCFTTIEDSWTSECIDYVMKSIKAYVMDAATERKGAGNSTTLDEWVGVLDICNLDAEDDTWVVIYCDIRAWQRTQDNTLEV